MFSGVFKTSFAISRPESHMLLLVHLFRMRFDTIRNSRLSIQHPTARVYLFAYLTSLLTVRGIHLRPCQPSVDLPGSSCPPSSLPAHSKTLVENLVHVRPRLVLSSILQ